MYPHSLTTETVASWLRHQAYELGVSVPAYVAYLGSRRGGSAIARESPQRIERKAA